MQLSWKANLKEGETAMTKKSGFRMMFAKLHLAFCVAIACGLMCVCGCSESVAKLESAITGHSILVVRFSNNPDKDRVLLDNVLRVGGAITCGCDNDYVSFLRNYDGNFDATAALDREGRYVIQPAVLNWISSRGWKFQQKFCVNLNHDNAEYYFVK